MDFMILCPPHPLARIGDLVAFDEVIRRMRDRLPNVQFGGGLVQLKQDKAATTVSISLRTAMVVWINTLRKFPIILNQHESSPGSAGEAVEV